MSTAALPEMREGYFPQWKLKTAGVIMPEERLPWGQTIVSGLQHAVAMAGGTIIVPLIMGFDPNLALLFSGVGTLIFFVVVAGRVPSYLGSSFSFIAVVIAASGYSGHGPRCRDWSQSRTRGRQVRERYPIRYLDWAAYGSNRRADRRLGTRTLAQIADRCRGHRRISAVLIARKWFGVGK